MLCVPRPTAPCYQVRSTLDGRLRLSRGTSCASTASDQFFEFVPTGAGICFCCCQSLLSCFSVSQARSGALFCWDLCLCRWRSSLSSVFGSSPRWFRFPQEVAVPLSLSVVLLVLLLMPLVVVVVVNIEGKERKSDLRFIESLVPMVIRTEILSVVVSRCHLPFSLTC